MFFFSADLSVTLYRLPRQCQDFLPGQEMGGAGSYVHVYLVAISCDVICNSQSEPAQAEFSLVCSEEITVFQWRKNVKKIYEI